jgi:hypothetical protein
MFDGLNLREAVLMFKLVHFDWVETRYRPRFMRSDQSTFERVLTPRDLARL